MVAADQPSALQAQLEANWHYDWLAARQPFRGSGGSQLENVIDALTTLAAAAARARLLFSVPLLGPVGSLLAHDVTLAAPGKLAEALNQAQVL
jgi:hypothetical protein